MKNFIKACFSTKKRAIVTLLTVGVLVTMALVVRWYHYNYKLRESVVIFNLQPADGMVSATNCDTGEPEAFRVERSPMHFVQDTTNRKASYSGGNVCRIKASGIYRDNFIVKRTRNIVASECGTTELYDICKNYVRN